MGRVEGNWAGWKVTVAGLMSPCLPAGAHLGHLTSATPWCLAMVLNGKEMSQSLGRQDSPPGDVAVTGESKGSCLEQERIQA